MSNKLVAINPSSSGIQASVEFLFLSEHKKLVNKNREIPKLHGCSLHLNTLFNAKLLALSAEHDPMLSFIVKTLQDKVDRINANSYFLNQFIRDLHEFDGLLYMDGNLHEAHPRHFMRPIQNSLA